MIDLKERVYVLGSVETTSLGENTCKEQKTQKRSKVNGTPSKRKLE